MRVLALGVALLFLSGCSLLFNGGQQSVLFTSSPPGATVKVRGKEYTTPFSVKVRNKGATYEASLAGHENQVGKVREEFAGAFLLNLLSPYGVGFVMDLITSSVQVPSEHMHVDLRPIGATALR